MLKRMGLKGALGSLAVAVMLAVVGAATAGVFTTHRAASGSETYTTDDGPSVPDGPAIHRVVVSNDDQGILTFVAYVQNRPTLLDSMGAYLMLDPQGSPTLPQTTIVLSGHSGLELYVHGGLQVSPGSMPSLSASYADGVFTVRADRKDLGIGNEAVFQILVYDGAVLDAKYHQPAQDRAPIDRNGPNQYATYKIKLATAAVSTTTAQSTTVKTPPKAAQKPQPKPKPKAKPKPKPKK